LATMPSFFPAMSAHTTTRRACSPTTSANCPARASCFSASWACAACVAARVARVALRCLRRMKSWWSWTSSFQLKSRGSYVCRLTGSEGIHLGEGEAVASRACDVGAGGVPLARGAGWAGGCGEVVERHCWPARGDAIENGREVLYSRYRVPVSHARDVSPCSLR
jgi:hypothetical protein